MSRHEVVLLVALAVLAGCGGVAERAPTTETLTPVPLPTETQSPVQSPSPGRTATATAGNATHWLVLNHRRALDGRSVTVRLNRTVLAENGTVLRQQRVDARFSADRTRYRLTSITGRGPDRTEEILRSVGEGNGTGGAVENRSTDPPDGADPSGEGPRFDAARELLLADPTLDDRLSTLLGAPEVSVVGQLDLKNYDVNVTTTVDTDGIASAEGVDAVENASLALLIDQRGLVRYYRFTYTATTAGRRVTVVERVGFVRVGGTDPDGPADLPWVSDGARNDTSTPRPG